MTRARRLLRSIALGLPGSTVGAGTASLAQAASRQTVIGPAEMVIFGASVPVWSALFGLAGLVLARRVAPISAAEEHLDRQGRAALTVLLAIGVMALIIAGEKRPIVALAWSVGLGFSGMAFINLVADGVTHFAKLVMDSFASSIAAMARSWNNRDKNDDA